MINFQNSHKMRLEYAPYLLNFKEPGGTSRGILTQKPTYFIKVYEEENPSRFGIGEAALFPGLSPEAGPGFEKKLEELKFNFNQNIDLDLSGYSSILFGLEAALLDLTNGCKGIYFPDENYINGKESININGLVWMGDFGKMLERIEDKINEGFKCIKLKIGAINWDKELEMIRHIRKNYDEKDLIIRVDANGGFRYEGCLKKLSELKDLGVHSIEQPIKAGNPELMAKLCHTSPLPIALDEELIGKGSSENRITTLEIIKPQFIILKPSLCGGLSGAVKWIEEADKRGIGWWITSALESNVGLNAIAQFTAAMKAKGPQGLGTGNLFTNNFKTPLALETDRLYFKKNQPFDYSQFSILKWIN